MTYDTAPRTITVEVTEDLATGELTPAVVEGSQISPTFTNTYSAETAEGTGVKITATKDLDGRDLKAGEFHFFIETPSGYMDGSGSNDANGNISFGEMTYDLAKVQQFVEAGDAVENEDGSWTISYIAYEGATQLPTGVTQNTGTPDNPLTFTVTVRDNHDGTLTRAGQPAGGRSGL